MHKLNIPAKPWERKVSSEYREIEAEVKCNSIYLGVVDK